VRVIPILVKIFQAKKRNNPQDFATQKKSAIFANQLIHKKISVQTWLQQQISETDCA
jgi:hypothetical protein